MNRQHIQQRAPLHARKSLVARQGNDQSSAPAPPTETIPPPPADGGGGGNGGGGGGGHGGDRPPINLSRTVDLGPTIALPIPPPADTVSSSIPAEPTIVAAPITTAPPISIASSAFLTTALRTNTRPLTSTASTAEISPSTTAEAGSKMGAGTIVGGIGGALLAIGALAFAVVFFVRRYRRKANEEDGFDPADFRKSAVLLDDSAIKEAPSFNPRPPTMIERHVAHAPPMGGYQYGDQGQAAYPGDNFGHIGQYPSDQMYGPAVDQYGQPVYGQHAEYQPEYGQPASYGGYPQQGEYHPSSLRPGEAMPPQPPSPSLENPFSEGHNTAAFGPSDPMTQPTDGGPLQRPPTVYNPTDAYGGM